MHVVIHGKLMMIGFVLYSASFAFLHVTSLVPYSCSDNEKGVLLPFFFVGKCNVLARLDVVMSKLAWWQSTLS